MLKDMVEWLVYLLQEINAACDITVDCKFEIAPAEKEAVASLKCGLYYSRISNKVGEQGMKLHHLGVLPTVVGEDSNYSLEYEPMLKYV